MSEQGLTDASRNFIVNALTKKGVSSEQAKQMVVEFERSGQETEVGRHVATVFVDACMGLLGRVVRGQAEAVASAMAMLGNACEDARPWLERVAEQGAGEGMCGCLCVVSHPEAAEHTNGGCVEMVADGGHARTFAVDGCPVDVMMCAACAEAVDVRRAKETVL